MCLEADNALFFLVCPARKHTDSGWHATSAAHARQGVGMGSVVPSGVRPFDFEGAPVRIATRDGEPWFVLADVCRVLGIANIGSAAGRLDDDEKTNIRQTDVGGIQWVTDAGGRAPIIISESGLYRIVMRSDKPTAKRFQKWVASDVLPAIRKTGSYAAPSSSLTREQLIAQALVLADETIREKDAVIEEQKEIIADMEPKVAALHRISTADGSTCVTDIAKALNMRRKDLFAWLQANSWIYRRAGGSGYVAYQNRIKQGVLEMKVNIVPRSDGTEKIVESVRVTAKGIALLAEIFEKRDAKA